ncbi:hypothetical protein O9992_19300 [Vibrio lentus]|nr:hypothetical protein [Vibrio lentus]
MIGNAIKFTERGHVHVSIKYRKSSFNITVEDSGWNRRPAAFVVIQSVYQLLPLPEGLVAQV